MNKKIFLCVHGHFYQPPRENPWTNEIDSQPSAAPFHDWNERILQESYKPNTEAVIVDKHDNVLNRINNYLYFNFDFGPTLLAWIRKKHPKTYEKIVDGDRQSVLKYNGHGNAIAMVYNHMIMPLANLNDKITQVKWGLADFRFHFERHSEGIWLPETACSDETLDVLINEGIKYIILDPSQAEKIRKIGKGKWRNVTSDNFDTQSPYRYFKKDDDSKYIDIFFYNGSLSKNIAFDEYIFEAEKLMKRIKDIHVNMHDHDNIISVAVDGETFGHHKKYTERTMSYLFSEIIPHSNYQLTNFGEYLSSHPPRYEVKIKNGMDGEGTSWSCIHGVGRWKENCGCGNGDNEWTQEWRKPLRQSLNWLRDEVSNIYENTGKGYLNDVWEARNDYINIILQPTTESRESFFYFHSKRFLNEFETDVSIKLLEMQRHSMLMFTSCGWFFSDISGIETIQILGYAARAIELAHEVSNINLESEFLSRLAGAKSNLKKYKDGRDLYLQNKITMKRMENMLI